MTRRRAPDDELDDQGVELLVVPYVPVRCPSCGRHKVFTYAVRGAIRWHRCQLCGQRYKSQEMAAADVPGWNRQSG
jgi:uncharacterized protein (DUF983 family)